MKYKGKWICVEEPKVNCLHNTNNVPFFVLAKKMPPGLAKSDELGKDMDICCCCCILRVVSWDS